MWNMETISKKSIILSFWVLVLFFLHTDQKLFASTDDYAKFVTIADIHFDPFIECQRKPCPLIAKLQHTSYQQWEKVFDQYSNQPATYYTDTNYALLRATRLELSLINQQQHPVFVLVLGDFLAHDFRQKYTRFSNDKSMASYREFVKNTLQFISYEFQKAFPDIDIYPVIGNNDSYTGDYSVIPYGEFLRDTENTWSGLIKNNENKKSFIKTFAAAGFYEVTVPNEADNKIIILNTVIFSNNSINKAAKAAAQIQLNWLHEKLKLADQLHQHVLIACHIPLGIDIYDTIQSGFDLKELWRVDYAEKFVKEIKEYAPVVTEILAGHIHTEIFKMTVPKKIASVPISITPSISPIFGNDPGLKVFLYEKDTFRIKDVSAVFFYHPLLGSSKLLQR